MDTVKNAKPAFMITAYQAEEERRLCYREMKLPAILDTYRYPQGAVLTIETLNENIVDTVSGLTYNAARKRIAKVKTYDTVIRSYITIQSKFNSKAWESDGPTSS